MMLSVVDDPRWVAAYSDMRWRRIPGVEERRKELLAVAELRDRKFDFFCPFERVTRQEKLGGVSRKGKTAAMTFDEPVFAPYIFIRTFEFMAACRVPGVLSLVTNSGRPVIVPDRVVGRLRSISKDEGLVRRDLTKNSFWLPAEIDDEFEFAGESPFRGFCGKITCVANLDKSGEIRAWIKMFGGEREVTVPISHINPAKLKKAAA